MLAICYTKPGTALTFWLNRYYTGGYIWSLVRTAADDRAEPCQPALRFQSELEAQAFIQEHCSRTPNARAVEVFN